MTIWMPALEDREGPRYLAIAEALAEDVAEGKLRPGVQLPTHRDLADRLGVTVGTVSRAYAEAARRGVVTGEIGRGTFVRSPAPDLIAPALPRPHPPGFLDLSVNHPVDPPDGQVEAALTATLARISGRGGLSALLGYPPDGGLPEHRAAGAAWAARSGLQTSPDHVLVTAGSQHAMTSLFTVLLRPGDLVVTEALTYPGLKALAGLLHLRLQGLAWDEHGLRPDALEAACRAGTVKALYCVPTLQNPTATVMPEARRREVAAVARHHGVLIVEDDVNGQLLLDPLPPLATFAPESTLFLGGTAKSLAPGLRIGYLCAPPALVGRLASGVRATTWMAAPLMAEIAARWIADGTAERVLEGRRRETAERRRVLEEVLGPVPRSHPAASHVWLPLPEPWRAEAFADELGRRGVAVTPASAFAVARGASPQAIRLCLGAARDRSALARGLRILAETLRGSPAEVPLPAGP
jgi:DNA-binding transcriptional MocR family regulator